MFSKAAEELWKEEADERHCRAGGAGGLGQRPVGERTEGKFRVVIVRECKCVVSVVILQPLTVFPETLSAVCSPAGFVGVGVILSTAFSAVVLRRNHFDAAGSHLVASSLSLWSDKAPLPFYPVMKANPEFQCRVIQMRRRGLPAKSQSGVLPSCRSVTVSWKQHKASRTAAPSHPCLALGPGKTSLCLPESIPFRLMGAGSGMSPAGVHQTGFAAAEQVPMGDEWWVQQRDCVQHIMGWRAGCATECTGHTYVHQHVEENSYIYVYMCVQCLP